MGWPAFPHRTAGIPGAPAAAIPIFLRADARAFGRLENGLPHGTWGGTHSPARLSIDRRFPANGPPTMDQRNLAGSSSGTRHWPTSGGGLAQRPVIGPSARTVHDRQGFVRPLLFLVDAGVAEAGVRSSC